MMENQKANLLVAPISLCLLAILSLIFGLCSLNWMTFLIGGLVGLMCHALMIKQNARAYRMVQLNADKSIFDPKKSAILWFILRFVLMIAIFAVIIYKADISNNPNNIWDVVLALIGYMIVKIVFITCICIFKEKKKVIE